MSACAHSVYIKDGRKDSSGLGRPIVTMVQPAESIMAPPCEKSPPTPHILLSRANEQFGFEEIPSRIWLTGNSIPCSFPDRSLFRLGLETRFFSLKQSDVGSYRRMVRLNIPNSLYFSLLAGN